MPEIFSFNIGINELQKKILLAALSKNKNQAISYFEEVKQELLKIDSDPFKALLKLDIDSAKLLTHVYFNLNNVQDSLLSQFKSTYKINTLRGKYYLNIAAQIAKVFEANQIPFIFLKGIAIVLLTHNNFGIRPMTDIDVFVPPDKVEPALRLLERELKMKIRNYDLEFYNNNIIHAITLRRETNLQIDLHFYFHDFAYHTDNDAKLWETRIKVNLTPNQFGFVPSPTFLLYRNLIHGIDGNAIRWVTDSLSLIEESNEQINWIELFNIAKSQNTLWPIINRIKYLKSDFGLEISDELNVLIQTAKVSIAEKIYFHYYTDRSEIANNETLKFKFAKKSFFPLDFYLYRRYSEKGNIFQYFLKRKRVLAFIKLNFSNKGPYD